MPGPQRRLPRSGVRFDLAGLQKGVGVDPVRLADLVDVAVLADAAGVDGFFLRPSGGVDPYVVLGAVASVTEHLLLGCLAAPPAERPPAVLAKLVTSLDVVSEGRAVLCLGPTPGTAVQAPADRTVQVPADGALQAPVDGALQAPVGGALQAPVDGAQAPREGEESRARRGGHSDGRPGPGAARRDEPELADALEICRALVRVPAPSYTGTTASITEAWNEPRFDRQGPMQIALLVPAGTSSTGLGDAPLPATSPPPVPAPDRWPAPSILRLAAGFAEMCLLEVGRGEPGAPVIGARSPSGSWALGADEVRRDFDAMCFEAGRLPDEVGLLAVCSVGRALSEGAGGSEVEEVLRRVLAWRRRGYDGVVLDVGRAAVSDGRLGHLLASLVSLEV